MYFLPDTAMILEYMEMGGFVMLPLVLVSVLLWYALAFRILTIKEGSQEPRELIRKLKNGTGTLEQDVSIPGRAAKSAIKISERARSRSELKYLIKEEFAAFQADISGFRKLVRALVAVAPLLGLLGTVDGMIETFSSLADMALFTQSGGIAGGISKALFTTQMGLAVSIPGLLLGRVIERREQRVNLALDQIRDLVCADYNNRSQA